MDLAGEHLCKRVKVCVAFVMQTNKTKNSIPASQLLSMIIEDLSF